MLKSLGQSIEVPRAVERSTGAFGAAARAGLMELPPAPGGGGRGE